ncbi:hypothetical protein ACFPJ4_13175 [Lysinimonas soli]|uniref:Uncharacterized protein n=1 Tax=Lysinimonas soli TaxID=1074233 RepID=A0ABW0NUG7_9MICO
MPQPIRVSAPPTGEVFFPLASNAHSLVAGAGIGSVRGRLKTAAILYQHVLVEAGQVTIHAGANASMAWRDGFDPSQLPEWQSTRQRSLAQGGSFYASVAPEASYGVPSPGPTVEIVNSVASIAWAPTFHPFARELPKDQDWLTFGFPGDVDPSFDSLLTALKRVDAHNPALDRLVSEHFVKSQLIDDVAKDLVTGASGGWDVSVDSFHARVFAARSAADANLKVRAFALPILVPGVRSLPWEEIAKIRKAKSIELLRATLREVEVEAYEIAIAGGDIERAVHSTFQKKIAAATSGVDRLLPTAGMALANLTIGLAAGYATIGLGWYGPIASLAPAATIATIDVASRLKARRQRSWIGLFQAMAESS